MKLKGFSFDKTENAEFLSIDLRQKSGVVLADNTAYQERRVRTKELSVNKLDNIALRFKSGLADLIEQSRKRSGATLRTL